MTELVGKTRYSSEKKNFSQSVELFVTLKDIDAKKVDLNINEVVFLPNPLPKVAKVVVFAGGDLALKAERAKADKVISSDELDKLAANKRQARKLAKEYDFFLAETALMAKIGKSLGQILGPRGKMPTPVPPNAPIDAMVSRYRVATRVRGRQQLSFATKIGEESMPDAKIAENGLAVVGALEKKLPRGQGNIRSVLVKLSMSKPAKMLVTEAR
jgi:large subunit ribosomal protein L1